MSFFVKINSFSNIFDLNWKILPCFTRKQEKICGKIRGFVDSEFVKTCHEHVIGLFPSNLEEGWKVFHSDRLKNASYQFFLTSIFFQSFNFCSQELNTHSAFYFYFIYIFSKSCKISIRNQTQSIYVDKNVEIKVSFTRKVFLQLFEKNW